MDTGEISIKVFLDRGDARFRAHRVGAFGELLAVGSWQLIGDLFFGMRRMLKKRYKSYKLCEITAEARGKDRYSLAVVTVVYVILPT